MTGVMWSPPERASILARFGAAFVAEDAAAQDEDHEQARAERAKMDRLAASYVAGCPFMPLFRDPFSGAVVVHSIDPIDTDGLWWRHDARHRPEERRPPTWFATTGALRPGGPLTPTPFLVSPGAGRPYVIPALLGRDGMLAVLGVVRVGAHTAYPAMYFADPIPWDAPRVNDWGLDGVRYRGPAGTMVYDERPLHPPQLDYELGPWIERGKLRWTAPDDGALELHETTAGCPYLDLGGDDAILYEKRGNTWLGTW